MTTYMQRLRRWWSTHWWSLVIDDLRELERFRGLDD